MTTREQAFKVCGILTDFKKRRLSDSSVMQAFRDIDAVYREQPMGEMTSINYLDSRVQCMGVKYQRDGQTHHEFGMVWPKSDHSSNMTCLDIDDARTVLPALQAWVAEREGAA